MLPNFLVIGAMLSGTTSLYHYLSAHPDVFMPGIKELDFFGAERNWHLGTEWYEEQFARATSERAVGEASVNYTMYPLIGGVPERIAKTLGEDLRLIYLVRDPIERMRSQYLYFRYPKKRYDTFERERRPVDVALLQNSFYLDCSRYAFQLERYELFFPKEHVLVLTSEELRTDRRAAMRLAFEFLQVDPDFEDHVSDREYHRTEDVWVPRPAAELVNRVPGYAALNKRLPGGLKRLKSRFARTRRDPGKGEMSERVREELRARLRDDVTGLRTWIRRPFDGWGIA